MSKQIHTTNHGNAKMHNFGKHGEHAHDFSMIDGRLHKNTRDLTELERLQNGDIL